MRGIILERTAGQPAQSIGSATTALRQKITFGKKAPSRRPQLAALLQGHPQSSSSAAFSSSLGPARNHALPTI